MKRTTVDSLRRLRRVVATHGDRDQKVAYNALVSTAKGRRFDTCDSKYGYGERARPAVEAADFERMAKQYHRKNAVEVQLQRPSGLLNH
jgi:hypothetical protein